MVERKKLSAIGDEAALQLFENTLPAKPSIDTLRSPLCSAHVFWYECSNGSRNVAITWPNEIGICITCCHLCQLLWSGIVQNRTFERQRWAY